MQRLRVPVYYDFASSLCYVAHRVMERLAGPLDDLGIELAWTPLDLTGLAGFRRGAALEGPRRANVLRVAQELGVPVRIPACWMDSREANAVGLALASTGSPREPTWRERVFSSIQEEGRSLDESGAVARLAGDLGLELAELLSPERLDALERETARARDDQVTGVPTFMLDGWALGGIQEDATMLSLLGRWAARRRPAGP
jgi:predicted DsbA family dithiol-disulfide isomerase